MNRPAAITITMMLCATLLVRAQQKPFDEILKSNDDTTRINDLVDASYHIADKNLPLADSLLDVALGISDRIGYDNGIARVYNNRALYLQRRKEYKASLEWFEKSAAIFRRLNK